MNSFAKFRAVHRDKMNSQHMRIIDSNTNGQTKAQNQFEYFIFSFTMQEKKQDSTADSVNKKLTYKL